MAGATLSVLARHYWTMVAQAIAAIGIIMLLVRLVDLASERSMRRSLETGVQEKIAVITLAQRLFKILAFFALLLILLRQAGVNVSAMLAGLGIGGIALALAAQNTLADLFGGITIISRETIRVGDYCKLADQTGTVEDIGLSSTRLRTLDRTVVSIPNSKIAQLASENFTLRDIFWFHHILSLRFDTTQPQIEQILTSVRSMLEQDPEVVKDGTIRVNLVKIHGAAFDIEIFAYKRAANYPEFLGRQGELLLNILAAITQLGVHLAFPSQLALPAEMYVGTPEMVRQQRAIDDLRSKIG
jgi:MscS family membrane protein